MSETWCGHNSSASSSDQFVNRSENNNIELSVNVSCSDSISSYNLQTTPSNPLILTEEQRIIQILVIFMGCIGTLANGLVVYVLGRSDQQKKSVHIFIINQLALDLFTSVSLILTYIWKLAEVRLYGTLNFVLCLIIGSEDMLWMGLNGSFLNLTFMTIERYIKIVFPIFHRNHYNKWITYFLMALAWVTGALMNFPVVYVTGDFSNGNCIAYANFPSLEYGLFVGMYFVLLEYIIPIVTFLICYGHIIVVIRRSGKQFASEQNGASAVQVKNTKSERSIIKIMATVSLLFTVCWTPLNVHVLVATSGCCGLAQVDTAWYVSLFLGHLTICIQPFIYVYGLKPEALKIHLWKIFQKKNTATTDRSSMSQETSQGFV